MTSLTARDAPPPAVPLWVWAAWVLAFMLVSAVLPRDASYDVAHYHIHNGWAALHGRIDRDFAPADMHSFINPAYNILVYWLIERLPGPAVNALVAVPQALILPLLYVLCRTLSLAIAGRASMAACLIVALAGFIAEGHLNLFASLRNDAWGAGAFLAALVLAIGPGGRLAGPGRLAAASLLLGAAFGMKATNLAYVLAFAVFVGVLAADWRERLGAALACALAGGAATLLLAGPYAWVLWERFANPLFPMANGLFESPLGPTDYDAYDRRKPGGVLGLLAYPFVFTFDATLIGSEDTDDVRFLMAYLASFGLLGWAMFRGRAGKSPAVRLVLALSLGMLVAMLTWMQVFSVLRYLLAAWILGPLLAYILWLVLARESALTVRAGRVTAIAGLALLAMTGPHELRRATWERWDAPYAGADIPMPERFEEAILLFSGDYPSAFLAPQFPGSAVFGHVAMQDYFRPALENYRPRLRAFIEATQRPVYAVTFSHDTPADVLAKIARLEPLAGDPAFCEPVRTGLDAGDGSWFICPLQRRGAGQDVTAALRH